MKTSSLKSDEFKMNGEVTQISSISPGSLSSLGFVMENASKKLENTVNSPAVINIVFKKTRCNRKQNKLSIKTKLERNYSM